MSDTDLAKVASIVKRMRLLLAGLPPHVQGAVLADLLAIWLAGHRIEDDPAETTALREKLLTMHLEMVRQLIPPNAMEIHGTVD